MRLLSILLIGLIGANDDPPKHPAIPADPLAKGVKAENRERFLQGLSEAEALRLELLKRASDGGRTTAHRLGEAVARFRERSVPGLQGRPGLDRFVIAPHRFEAKIRGDDDQRVKVVDSAAAFEPFAGRWHGLWKDDPVDHDWSRVVIHEPPATATTEGLEGLRIRATQSAWVGDGFGWNATVIPKDSGGEVILGTVYHVEDGDPNRIRLHRPHVGVEMGTGRLIWITAREVFLEEALSSPHPEDARYAITGFRYTLREGKIAVDGEAFQAVYGRDPNHRPAWHSLPIDLDSPEIK